MDLLHEKRRALGQRPQVAAAIIGAGVAGGAISASASKSAANTQAGSAREATQAQRDMFNTTVGQNAPFREAGVGATSKLSELLGISSPNLTRQQVFDEMEGNRLAQDGQTAYAGLSDADKKHWDSQIDDLYQRRLAAADPSQVGSNFGSLIKPFGMSNFQMDPGVQFQMQQGNQALMNSQAAKNGVLSGGALKDLMAYNQGMAGTGYQSAYERYMANKNLTLSSLMGVAGIGQNAASNTGNNAASMAGGISNTITGAGNAQAAGIMGAGNAMSGAVTSAGNGYALSRMMDTGGPTGTVGGYTAPNGTVYNNPSAYVA